MVLSRALGKGKQKHQRAFLFHISVLLAFLLVSMLRMMLGDNSFTSGYKSTTKATFYNEKHEEEAALVTEQPDKTRKESKDLREGERDHNGDEEIVVNGKAAIGKSIETAENSNDDKHHFSRTNICEALTLHEKGHWQHHYFSPNGSEGSIPSWNTSSFQNMYLPQEIDWIEGNKLPSTNSSTTNKCNTRGVMYTSPMGNQCFPWCGVEGFRPSHSVWTVQNSGDNDDARMTTTTTRGRNNSQQHHYLGSPSLRLIQRLAKFNETLCFAGDSIDFQIYAALLNNLQRIQLLQSQSDDNRVRISLESREIPVNYTKEYGEGAEWIKGWMVMRNIPETRVTLEYGDGNISTSAFRWYKTYAYTPWNFEFMNDCSVVIFNLGLHYNAHNDGMLNDYYGKHKLVDDMHATITYMVDFIAAKKNRIAVWRSALPQHFDNFDGHYEKHKNCSSKPLNLINSTQGQVIQNYNKAYDRAFSTLCNDTSPPQTSCDHLEHICTMNRTSMDYPTVYQFLSDNNFTKHMERFRDGNNIVTGKILRWNIADLFNVPQWHATFSDCSHFCYVPPLYEAAFERLLLLLDHHSASM